MNEIDQLTSFLVPGATPTTKAADDDAIIAGDLTVPELKQMLDKALAPLVQKMNEAAIVSAKSYEGATLQQLAAKARGSRATLAQLAATYGKPPVKPVTKEVKPLTQKPWPGVVFKG